MSANTTEDIRAMSDDQITKRLNELAKDKLNLRFQKGGGQLEDSSQIRKTRREVAQLKTIRTERTKNAVSEPKKKTKSKKKN